jgi:hypothetical protein
VDQEWKIAKPGAACSLCNAPFVSAVPENEQPPVNYYSVLLQKPEGLVRQDFCLNCFKDKRPADVYYFWKAVPPSRDPAAARKQPVVDVEYVLEFFKRLEGDPTPQRIAFRYILALMLTRKKLLIAEGKGGSENGMDVQLFREKRGSQSHRVLSPELNQDEITAVSAELGELLGLTPKQPAPTGNATATGGTAAAPSGDNSATVSTAGSDGDAESIRRTQ